MPELPEVETIVRALRDGGRGGPPIIDWVIEGARLLWPRTLAQPGQNEFLTQITRQRVGSVGRRGKFILLNLDTQTLLMHLRMSGDLRVEKSYSDDHKILLPQLHDRLLISFTTEYRLAFNDTRKFGRVWLVNDPSEILGGLGPEPLDDQFTPKQLYERLQKSKRQIKPLLLDQTVIAGLGNIYTDESLNLACIHPLQISNTLAYTQVEILWAAIRRVLKDGIARNGASIDWVYRGGSYQNQFRVYQRTGEPCLVCGTPVEKLIVGQRSTHYCPMCQPLIVS
ncbi:MAG: bifunctional DNA-formamidopyrimidine glycosylase/DNA-(apurinic or apyrimidinic site) lyase [Anaerolineaceae bacterium]